MHETVELRLHVVSLNQITSFFFFLKDFNPAFCITELRIKPTQMQEKQNTHIFSTNPNHLNALNTL